LGGSTATGPLPIAAVFFTSYEAGAKWDPTELSPAEGVLRMTEHAVAARSSPERVLRTLSTVARSARFFESPRPDVDECAVEILATFRDLTDG
jgi:hypothetical protein